MGQQEAAAGSWVWTQWSEFDDTYVPLPREGGECGMQYTLILLRRPRREGGDTENGTRGAERGAEAVGMGGEHTGKKDQ